MAHLSAALAAPSVARTRRPGLDIVRGSAIILVMLRHSWPSLFPGAGITGVVIFFVLSGYLITGVLMSDIIASGRVHLARFYRHRAWRLYPALLAYLVGWGVIQALTDWQRGRVRMPITMVAGAFYLTDLNVAISPTTTHLWTLAVEEQFYLIWPALLVFAFRRRLGLIVSLLVAGLACASAVTLHLLHGRIAHAYTLPTSWAICLLVGATARLYAVALLRLLRPALLRTTAVLAIAALAATCLLSDNKASMTTYLVVAPLVALLAVPVVLQANTVAAVPVFLKPLCWMGLISYAAYLWNYPISLWMLGPEFGRRDLSAVSAIVVTIAVAALSWFTVEALGRAGRTRTDRRAARFGDARHP